jgi:hypothetical protein
MEWKYVRHVVLSVNPSLYRNGEDADEDIACRRGIGNLVKNLERSESLDAQGFRSFLSVVDFLGSDKYWVDGKGPRADGCGAYAPTSRLLKNKVSVPL